MTILASQIPVTILAIALAAGLMQFSPLPAAAADPSLQGRVEESGAKQRLTRPQTPMLKTGATSSTLQGGNKASATAETAKFDDSSFRVITRDSALKGALDLSHWNPWASTTRLRGYSSSLQPSGFLLARRYQQPLMHGDARDLAAIERAWRPSSRHMQVNGRSMTVVVNLALCRPGNPQQAAAWDTLMQELKVDADRGNMWRQWQNQLAEDIASQSAVLGNLPGNGAIHVRITPTGIEAGRRPQRLDSVRSQTEALAQLVHMMGQNGRLTPPVASEVSEVHVMIVVHSLSPYMGNGQYDSDDGQPEPQGWGPPGY